jgi:sec-independent protein translocase protein TatB
MFDSIGWGEIVVLGLAALFIFGPERLPHLAKDAAAGLGRVRGALSGARGQLFDTLGPDFDSLTDVDLRQCSPRAMLRRALIDEDDASSAPAVDPVAQLAAGRARVADPQPSPRDLDAD